MNLLTRTIAALAALAVTTTSALAIEVGKPAPAFTLKNLSGEEVSLSDFKGKTVVLEWINFDCPFVKKHYEGGAEGNIPTLQAGYADKDVVWLTICSSAEGKQGYLPPSEMAERAAKEGSKSTHFLMDADGTVGKAFNAKVTPHMYIICKDGVLRYNGAIDSISSLDAADIEKADKLFVIALDAVLAGEEVENATNQPYGCSVKY